MQRFLQVFLLSCFCLSVTGVTSAQQATDDFTRLSDSVLSSDNIAYSKLDQLLTPFAQDEILLDSLIEISKKTGNLIGEAYAYNQLGKLSANRFNYQKAIAYHRRALQIAKEKGQSELTLSTLNLLGSSSTRIDSIRNALEFHQQVIRMVNSEGTLSEDYQREAGKAYHGLGKIYQSLGRFDQAVKYFDIAIAEFKKINYTEGLAFSLNAKGESLEALGKLSESLSLYEESTRVNELLGSDRLMVLNTLGKAHVLAHEKNRAREAQELITSTLLEQTDTMDPELLALLYTQYGWVLNNLKQYDLAEEQLNKGLELARQLNFTSYIYDCNIWLHDGWEARGDFKKALYYYKAAHATRNKVINRRNLQMLYDAVNVAESEKRGLQIQMLARENEIVGLKLRRNQTLLLVGALLVILVAMIMYTIYRQSIANNEKKVMVLEQSRLRSQMNPHFLFNSMNSIKHYIINNEQKNAVHYLNKFSKLIRRILESSSLKENSLQEELKTVELYMNIENMRFDDQIEYEVDIDPEINPQTVKIPSLILQPFLENALWHGLSSKEGKKKIRLEVRKNKKGQINIAIRDNGIGREASEKLRAAKILKRKSMGISITRERLANFSRAYGGSFDLSIEDLYKGDGSVEGTQVTLSIPTA